VVLGVEQLNIVFFIQRLVIGNCFNTHLACLTDLAVVMLLDLTVAVFVGSSGLTHSPITTIIVVSNALRSKIVELKLFDLPGETVDHSGINVVLIAELLGQEKGLIIEVDPQTQ
jgi:hypothetical protein